MTEEQQKKELEIALTSYIALKHNQDECSGFIDGFKEALSLFAVSGRSEQLKAFQGWQLDKGYLNQKNIQNGMVEEYLKSL